MNFSKIIETKGDFERINEKLLTICDLLYGFDHIEQKICAGSL